MILRKFHGGVLRTGRPGAAERLKLPHVAVARAVAVAGAAVGQRWAVAGAVKCGCGAGAATGAGVCGGGCLRS